MLPPETVTVAVRCEVVLFAVAVIVNEPLLLPLVGETVSHAALLDTDHDTLDVTVTEGEAPPLTPKLCDVGETVSVASMPACVTFIVLVIPLPETVTVALRCVVPVFAVAVIVNEPLLLPLVDETVSHVALLVTDHDMLDVTVTAGEVPPFEAKL